MSPDRNNETKCKGIETSFELRDRAVKKWKYT
jgi:hypothetical protein